MDDQRPLTVTIRNRNGTQFSGEAFAITAKNNAGVFDILPQHANFISLIEGNISLQKQDGETLTFQSKKGILRVKQNNVTILIEN